MRGASSREAANGRYNNQTSWFSRARGGQEYAAPLPPA